MKVLFIAPTGFKYGGDTLSLGQLIQGLKEKDIEMMLVTSSNESANFFQKLGISSQILKQPYNQMSIIRIPVNSIKNFIFFPYFHLRSIWRVYKANNAIEQIVKRFKPDIIHSNTSAVIAGHIISKKNNIAHFWHIREFYHINCNMKLIISKKRHSQLLSEKNNHIIFITECLKKYYNNLNNSKVIYDGITNSIQCRNLKNKSKYFLFVGRITEDKGADILINSFIDICKQNKQYKLLIAGEPANMNYKDNLTLHIKNNGIEDNVQFLGHRNDVFDLMAKATALIVPSLHEGFGRITVEALFNGCLVIGNRTTGTQEILEPDNLGLLYSGKEELVTRMAEVITNGIEYYFPMIAKAQKKALELYTQEQNVEKIYNYYQEILNGVKKNGK